jgi:6-phosphogluconate dehydrogenase
MELGMIGLGRMGANMTERLLGGGHCVVVYDRDSTAVQQSVRAGAVGVSSVPALVKELQTPRAVWLMIPSGAPVEEAIETLRGLLSPGDVVIDGGNSNYKESMRRAASLKESGLHFADVGTSGGIWGLREGYSLMIGGDEAVVQRLNPLFESLAPGKDRGWKRVGPAGAGHFVKMVHNGIEYGMMQAYAEGFAVMKKKEEFELDLPSIAELWRHGSVVRSWLLDLTADALRENPGLKGIEPFVQDSGEGRWMVAEAIAEDVSAPVITLALLERLRSREKDSFSDKMLAVMRNKFGGHKVEREP